MKKIVDKNCRIDKYIASLFEDYSRSYIQKIIKEGNVSVNDNVILKNKFLVKEGDICDINIPEPKKLELKPENIPLTIVYEDDDVMIVNKPAGMVVHPAPGNYEGTLVNALMYHSDHLSSINGIIRPGIVHRIDKDTSGLLMIAKTNRCHHSLAEQLKEHSITRKYIAIVYGRFSEKKGTINKPIGRSKKNRLKMAVTSDGKEAITHYEVLEEIGNYSVVECRLETGRTHQIRVHMAYISHPLLGDMVYGIKKPKIKQEGQLLHAKVIGFVHPVTNEYLEFNSDLPELFDTIIKKIRSTL